VLGFVSNRGCLLVSDSVLDLVTIYKLYNINSSMKVNGDTRF